MITELERCLRQGRKEKHLTQRDMAEIAGMALKSYTKLESSIFAPVDEEVLKKLAHLIDMDGEMLSTMYRSEYQRELKANTPSQAPIPDELLDLISGLQSLPDEMRTKLIDTIRILIKGQMAA